MGHARFRENPSRSINYRKFIERRRNVMTIFVRRGSGASRSQAKSTRKIARRLFRQSSTGRTLDTSRVFAGCTNGDRPNDRYIRHSGIRSFELDCRNVLDERLEVKNRNIHRSAMIYFADSNSFARRRVLTDE